jgi:hypothetical protein
MGSLTSLPALAVKGPDIDIQGTQAKQQQLQAGQLDNQIRQAQVDQIHEEQQDHWKVKAALQSSEFDGTPESLLKLSRKYGVSSKTYFQLADELDKHQKEQASLGSDQLKLGSELDDKLHSLMQDEYDAPASKKLEAQQKAKQQAITLITTTPGLPAALRQQKLQVVQQIPDDQYIGDDQLSLLIGASKLTSTLRDRAQKDAEKAEKQAQAANYVADVAKKNAELPFIAPKARAELAELQARTKKQGAEAGAIASNPALAGVPAHLVAPAITAATKAGDDRAKANQAAQNLKGFLDLADKGNKMAFKVLPMEGALQLATAQGVHRINRTEVDQIAGAGDLFDKINGRLGQLSSGQSIPKDVRDDMRTLYSKLAQNTEQTYKNRLKVINQNYGSKFAPVEMDGGDSVKEYDWVPGKGLVAKQ